MDGFAFAARDTVRATVNSPVALPIRGESRAGSARLMIGDGSACAINTGAIVPIGCDTVLPSEHAIIRDQAGGPALGFAAPEAPGRNVRLRGEDARVGETVLSSGNIIGAEAIGALACFGVTDLLVFAPPRLAIVATGDELTGDAPSGIVDSNGPMVAAAAQALGLPVTRHAPVGDAVGTIEASFRTILDTGSADILVSTGGVSAGDHDHVSAALAAMGATIHFHGIRMRPGKPVLFATFPNGTPFFGLPGNPVAALIGFRFLVAAAVRAMMDREVEQGDPVSLDVIGRPGTTVLLKARQGRTAAEIEILPGQQSHRMRSLLEANSWLAVDEGPSGSTRVRRFPLRPELD
jgi:molybdopterin molybdotransferase